MSSNKFPMMLYRADSIPGVRPVRSKPGKYWAIAQDADEHAAMLENGFFEGVYGDMGGAPEPEPKPTGSPVGGDQPGDVPPLALPKKAKAAKPAAKKKAK